MPCVSAGRTVSGPQLSSGPLGRPTDRGTPIPAARLQFDAVLAEVRHDLRNLIRIRDDLRTPLERFEERPDRETGPRFYITFDLRPRRAIKGLKLGGLKNLSLPDERISNDVLDFAASVWHLKDKLHRLSKPQRSGVNIESFAESHVCLLTCSDLANTKKHGANENRSCLNPHLGLVNFDLSRCGQIEFFYDGASKEKEVLVEHPRPIPFTVDLQIHDGSACLGDAIEFVARGLKDWLPLLNKLHVLAPGDRETEYLCQSLLPCE